MFLNASHQIFSLSLKNIVRQRIKTLVQTKRSIVLNIFSLNFGPKKPEKVCIVTGSGCDQLQNHKKEDFDTLITGEPRQSIYHYCKDHKLNVICAGHYLTEMLGVINLTKAIAKKYDLEWEFFDMPTGI